jgi:plasmid stability protein
MTEDIPMTEFRIRGLDPDTAQAVKAKAEAQGVSVNQTVKRLLAHAVSQSDRSSLPTPAHRAVSDRAISLAYEQVKKFAPANADPREVSAMFFGIASGYLAATVDAATYGASMDAIATAVTGEDFTDYTADEQPINRTALPSVPADDWDRRTGLSYGVRDLT